MSRNAAIIDDNSSIFKLLQNSSLSKAANIPMIVVRTFIPNNMNDDLTSACDLPPLPGNKISSGFKLFSNMSKNKQFKQIEIHRGMTINALFSRDNWLFIKTVQNESGYVPLDTCRPVIRCDNSSNCTQVIDSVSLLEISIKNKNYDELLFDEEDENLSELEFSQYDNQYKKLKQHKQLNDISNESQERLFKIRHYFESLEIETNIATESASSSISSPSNQQRRNSMAIDSGFSDCESNIILSKQSELVAKPTRRGIKTNGSICSISPNQTETISIQPPQVSVEPVEELIKEVEIVEVVMKPISNTRPNLSTIIEQSYNSTMELQRSESNSFLYNNSVVLINNKCDVSNLQTINSSKSSIIQPQDSSSQLLTSSTSYKLVIDDYQPLFVEDLAVFKGEFVTVLEDSNPEWCYVISKNGKGYVPRSSIQY